MTSFSTPDRFDGAFTSTPAARRRMQAQRRRDTAPEVALRRILHGRGLRFRLDVPIVPGTRRRRVDIVLPRHRIAVFVDGCFWHGCPEHGTKVHRANQWYWPAKIQGNKQRDEDTTTRLQEAGWTVVRVWEHEDPHEAAARVESAILNTAPIPPRP